MPRKSRNVRPEHAAPALLQSALAVGYRPVAASPRYIYASTARRRRRPYALLAGGAILAAVLAELIRAAL